MANGLYNIQDLLGPAMQSVNTASIFANMNNGNGLSAGGNFNGGYNPTGAGVSFTQPNGILGGGLSGLSDFFGSDAFSNISNGLGSIASLGSGIMQGLAGLQSYKLGKKSLGLAKDQFNFQKGLANRNIANQAKVINNTYDNAAQVAAGMLGSRNSDGTYGNTDQSTVNRYSERAKERHVDGSPIS